MEGDAVEPTASLLTAVLVAGASTMTGEAERNGQRLSLYDVNQGFGRVDLSRSLPLSGVTPDNWRLQVQTAHTRTQNLVLRWFSLYLFSTMHIVSGLQQPHLHGQCAGNSPSAASFQAWQGLSNPALQTPLHSIQASWSSSMVSIIS